MSFAKLYAKDDLYVIGMLQGRLGNQLFEIATTCAVAWDNGAEAYFPGITRSQYFDHVLFRCNAFPLKNKVLSEWQTGCYGYKPILFSNGMRIKGYSQNEQYFTHQRQRLIELFSPKSCDYEYIISKYGPLIDQPVCVGIHVRAFKLEVGDNPIWPQYDEEYYTMAMDYFPDDALFVVTSDSIEFAKKMIPVSGRDVVFIENEPPHIDFYLLSFCDHNIISNSTFSWWAAWLNQNPEKIVIRPKRWSYGDFEDIDVGGPDSWIKVDAKTYQENKGLTTKPKRVSPRDARGAR